MYLYFDQSGCSWLVEVPWRQSASVAINWYFIARKTCKHSISEAENLIMSFRCFNYTSRFSYWSCAMAPCDFASLIFRSGRSFFAILTDEHTKAAREQVLFLTTFLYPLYSINLRNWLMNRPWLMCNQRSVCPKLPAVHLRRFGHQQFQAARSLK